MWLISILLTIPAVLIAFYQVKVIWKNLVLNDREATEIAGHYTNTDLIRLDRLLRTLALIFWIQIVIPLFSITPDLLLSYILKALGYLLILSGFFISKRAVHDLGKNWSGMVDYRIKKGHQLVTSGVYGVVRHPIYLAALLEVIGYELVVNSWLWLVFGVIIIGFLRNHLRYEDGLLQKKFGDQFSDYKRRTKMLIPYIY